MDYNIPNICLLAISKIYKLCPFKIDDLSIIYPCLYAVDSFSALVFNSVLHQVAFLQRTYESSGVVPPTKGNWILCLAVRGLGIFPALPWFETAIYWHKHCLVRSHPIHDTEKPYLDYMDLTDKQYHFCTAYAVWVCHNFRFQRLTSSQFKWLRHCPQWFWNPENGDRPLLPSHICAVMGSSPWL